MKRIAYSVLVACAAVMGVLATGNGLFAQGVGPSKTASRAVVKVQPLESELPVRDIDSIGGFAGDRIRKNKDNYLEKFPIDNYIQLIETRNYTDWDWRKGEQPGKWLEASMLTASRTEDKALQEKARSLYDRVLKSQEADGYVGITSPSVRTPAKPLRGMDAYELYFLLHALLTGYEQWQDPKGLDAARKLGDYFLRYIGPGKAGFWPSDARPPDNMGKTLKGTQHSDIAGHSIHYSWEGTLLIDPMMRLYELSGDKRYLDWCKWVVANIDVWSGWDAYSRLDSVADGKMTIDKIQPYVHAHTFQMNFLGLLRMYQVTGDPAYLRKVEGAWDDIAKRQMYITGGVSVGEHYEKDYVKPIDGKMIETCATMSWMQLSEYLLELTGDTRYADVIEKLWWNQVFAAQTIDGDANRYNTPPDGVEPEGDFRDPDCCSSSGERLLSMLPEFIYSKGRSGEHSGERSGERSGEHSGERSDEHSGEVGGTIYINQFVPSQVNIAESKDNNVHLLQSTDYPSGTQDIISVDPGKSAPFTLAIRIPAWCANARVTVNGEAWATPGNAAAAKASAPSAPVPGKYLNISRTWKKGDRVTVDLPMKLTWVRHEHYLKTSNKKPYKTSPDPDAPYALVRGPLVYAVDNIWYTGDPADCPRDVMNDVKYVLSDPAAFKEVAHPEADLLGPGYVVPLIETGGRSLSMDVFPFANIGKWYKDKDHKPSPDSATYSYGIWLKGSPDFPAPPAKNVSLPKVFGDNMVLQQGISVPVWGKALPGTVVSVQFGTAEKSQKKTTTADRLGHWQVTLDPLSASTQPASMAIFGTTSGTGGNHDSSSTAVILLRNILVGEVWLCSGQSNMEYSMRKNSKFEDAPRYPAPKGELDKANNPYIRIFLVQKDFYKPGTPHTWDTASGKALRDFSAAGYFFGKELYRQLHVPIGIISASVSGSNIGPWLPDTGKFYQDMIEPLAPFGLKGFLWYQGETNTFLNETIQYTQKMTLLIHSWRQLWANLPFYFVQLPPFYYSQSKGGLPHTEETLPAFREAQTLALAIPHTGMVVTTDLVDSPNDLHPAYKWEVGRRLALWALANDYGKKEIVYSGPLYQGARVRKNKMILTFTHTGGGLISGDGKPLTWFSIAGSDHHFIPALAVIDGDRVIVSAPGVKSPLAVRFAWNEAAQPNLFNKEGLPASPFRTDNPYAGKPLTEGGYAKSKSE
jgi:DUF1680 family protein